MREMVGLQEVFEIISMDSNCMRECVCMSVCRRVGVCAHPLELLWLWSNLLRRVSV